MYTKAKRYLYSYLQEQETFFFFFLVKTKHMACECKEDQPNWEWPTNISGPALKTLLWLSSMSPLFTVWYEIKVETQSDMKSKWKHRFHAPGGRGSHAKISSHKEDKKENVLASNSKLLNAPCQAYVVKERRKKEKRKRKNSYLRTTIEIRLRIRNCWFLNRMEGHFWRAYKALSSVTKDKVRQEVILHLCPNLEDKLND